MEKYGFEHLRFSRNTYRSRNMVLLFGCLSILFFEYEVTQELKIYDVTIPSALIELSLYLGAIWFTLQFVFLSIDDYIDWKKNFLIHEKTRRPHLTLGDRTFHVEIHSFSKGEIKYVPYVGHSYGQDSPAKETEIKECMDAAIKQLEPKLKAEIESIESFKKWYKNFSRFTIFRFAVLEFALPLLFIIYAVVICQFFPILPIATSSNIT